MNNIKIVPMNADHLESLERLERICFSRPWSRKMLAEELENQCAAFLVAEAAVTDDVLGYAGQLLQVFLNFAEANHLAFLTLEVRPSNAAAIALYQGFGFQEAGRRKNYYDLPKEDALILTRRFDEEAAQ